MLNLCATQRRTNYDNSQQCSHTPSALNARAKRSGATCHMAMCQCCYLAKGAKRPSHTTNMLTSSDNNLKIFADMEYFGAVGPII